MNAIVIRALPSQLKHLHKALVRAPTLPPSDPGTQVTSTTRRADATSAALHSVGYGLRHLAIALSHMLRPPPQAEPPGTKSGSLATVTFTVGSAVSILGLLLPLRETSPKIWAMQPQGPESQPISPLALALGCIRDAALTASCSLSSCAVVTSSLGASLQLPMLSQARGHGEVELVDVRRLHAILNQNPTVIGVGALGAVTTCESVMDSALMYAATANGAQACLHGAMHALASCRQLLLLLPLASYADRRLGPRFDLLISILETLSPPQAPMSPAGLAPIAPSLTIAALASLRSLGASWRLSTAAQVQVISMAFAASTSPSATSVAARLPMYLVLLGMLSPLHAARTTVNLSVDYADFLNQVQILADRNVGKVACRPSCCHAFLCTVCSNTQITYCNASHRDAVTSTKKRCN